MAKTGAAPIDWFPDWSDQTCVIVASGPSAKGVDLARARNRAKFIAVNNSWQLCPWADVLYACDHSWWRVHKGVPEFKGLKVSQHHTCKYHFPDVKLVTCVRSYDGGDALRTDTPGKIGWGRNGGFQALNLAVQFKTKRILLVGFDMTLDHGLHWHGKHPVTIKDKGLQQRGLFNPHKEQVSRWRKVMDGLKPTLDRLGLTVINCSPVSALKAYPKMTLEEAFDCAP